MGRRQTVRHLGTRWYFYPTFLSYPPPTTCACAFEVLACTHYTELLDVRRFARQPGLALWEMQARVGQ